MWPLPGAVARRSRMLRQLKELAVLRLDAIQGGDPMIREGEAYNDGYHEACSAELMSKSPAVNKKVSFFSNGHGRIHEFKEVRRGQGGDPMIREGEAYNDGYHEACSAELMSKRPAVNKKVSFFSNGHGRIHEFNGETDNVKEVDEGYESSSSAGYEEVKGNTGKRSANGKPGLV